jgi:predicted DNA-binding transcriptional regulator AlpA
MSRQRRVPERLGKQHAAAIANEPRLDRRAAARRAGIGVKTMERKVKAGTFPPPGRLGRFPFWLQSSVDNWVAQQMSPCARYWEGE